MDERSLPQQQKGGKDDFGIVGCVTRNSRFADFFVLRLNCWIVRCAENNITLAE